MEKRIQREIVKTAWETVKQADLVLLLLDLTFPITRGIQEMLEKLKKLKDQKEIKDVVLVFNKVGLQI